MSQNTRYSNTKTQNRDKSVAFIGQYMKVKGCHKIEIIDKNDPDQGVQFRNMSDGCWPIINGLMRKDRGQIILSGNTLVKVYR
jgi:hypothetical protein